MCKDMTNEEVINYILSLPEPKDCPEFQEGTPEYEDRKRKLMLWNEFDLVVYDFMSKYGLPMEFRLDCYEVIKKYDSL